MMQKILFAAFFWGLLSLTAMDLAKGGRPLAEIRADAGELRQNSSTPWPYPVFREACTEFRKYLGLAAGADFSGVAGPNAVLLGRAALTDDALRNEARSLPHGAYVIRTENNRILRIFGSDITGTVCGMYAFLRDEIGIEFFGMDDRFIVVPPPGDLSVGNLDRRAVPDFRTRVLAGGVRPGTPGYRWGVRMGTFAFSDAYFIGANHAFYRLFPGRRYAAAHPEYYALRNGVRAVPQGDDPTYWQLCLSNDDVVKIVQEEARKAMQRGRICFSLVPNDSMLFCECPLCRARQPRRRDALNCYTDVHMDWVSRIAAPLAQEFPGHYVGVAAYGGTARPPLKSVPGNVFIAFMPDVSQYYDRSYMDRELRDIRSWLAKTSGRNPCGWHAYTGLGNIPPEYFPRHFGRMLGTFHHDYNFISFLGDGFGFWPFSGPQNYLIARLLWDADLDPDRLLDHYFTRLFGPAAAETAAFYALLEECHMRPRSGGRWLKNHRSLSMFEVYSLRDIAEMRRRLAAARAAGKGDSEVTERLRYLAEKMEPSLLMMEYYHLAGRNAAGSPIPAEVEKCIAIPDRVETLWRERILSDGCLGAYGFQKHAPKADYTARGRRLWRLDVEQKTARALLSLYRTAPAEFARLRKKFETDDLKAAVICLGTGEASAGGNLLANGGFETAGQEAAEGPEWKSSGIRGWAFWSSLPSVKTGRSEQHFCEGRHSAFISGGSGTLIIKAPLDFSDGRRIFCLAAWIRTDSSLGDPALSIAWGNEKGRMWKKGSYVSHEVVPDEKWTRVRLFAEAPSGVKEAILMLSAQNAASGTVWFDDVSFRKIAAGKK